ncbi:hypothetical protein GQ55_9G378000 [Panicum hallii var. hallii]|uniref:Uncharacterized protein n=1 Tax=Panicum hallii var. hallii TaxID=1504633 RepID=A0A2T7C955_9POAL|nr:hypothetical protein GQ55_9G378000 [Panicum hallii var. hallii]
MGDGGGTRSRWDDRESAPATGDAASSDLAAGSTGVGAMQESDKMQMVKL